MVLCLVGKGSLLRGSLPHYSNHINCIVSDIVTGSVLPAEENTNCYCSHQGCQQVSDVVECVCTCLLSGCVSGV